MTAKVILNPYSSRWKAGQRQAEVEAALNAVGVPFELTLTNAPNHAVELAAEAVREGFNPVLAAGGDGTLGEVINGMMQASDGEQPVTTFGLLPIGTANDLAANLHLPTEPLAAAKIIAAGHTRNLDVCKVNDRYFINNAGIGLEPFISVIQMEMTRWQGNLRYMVAALRGILKNPRWKMHLEWDGGSYEGWVTMISVGNGARTGGVFYTVPHADPFDGKLSFILGYLPTRLRLLAAMPMIMKPKEGNISEHPAVQEIHATWLKVRTESPTPAHADGEVFSRAINILEYWVLPGQLKMLLPK